MNGLITISSCGLCFNFLTIDQQVVQCEFCRNQILCKKCADSCKQQCAYCKQKQSFDFIPLSGQLLQLMSGIRMQCINHQSGCDQIIKSYGFDMQKHKTELCKYSEQKEFETTVECRICGRISEEQYDILQDENYEENIEPLKFERNHLCSKAQDLAYCEIHREPENHLFSNKKMFLYQKIEGMDKDSNLVNLYSIDALWDLDNMSQFQKADDEAYELVLDIRKDKMHTGYAIDKKLLSYPMSQWKLVSLMLWSQQCQICKNTSRLPHRCLRCNSSFCQLCISNHLNFDKNYCPVCCSGGKNFIKGQDNRQSLQRIKIFQEASKHIVVKCKNFMYGCKKVYRYCDIANKQVTEHLRDCDLCPNCQRKCEYCSALFKGSEEFEEHVIECKELNEMLEAMMRDRCCCIQQDLHEKYCDMSIQYIFEDRFVLFLLFITFEFLVDAFMFFLVGLKIYGMVHGKYHIPYGIGFLALFSGFNTMHIINCVKMPYQFFKKRKQYSSKCEAIFRYFLLFVELIPCFFFKSFKFTYYMTGGMGGFSTRKGLIFLPIDVQRLCNPVYTYWFYLIFLFPFIVYESIFMGQYKNELYALQGYKIFLGSWVDITFLCMLPFMTVWYYFRSLIEDDWTIQGEDYY